MKRFTLVLTGIAALLLVACFYFNPIKEKGKEFENEMKESQNKLQFIDEAIRQEFDRTKSPKTGKVPKENLLLAQQYATQRRSAMAQQNNANQRAIGGINWVERGPTNIGGRTRALLFDLNDVALNTVYAGAVDGGLWKCTNISAATPSWNKINDQFDNLSVTTIAQQSTNPNNMYFGTGEGWFNVDALNGLGIWRSTDNGATWTHLPSTMDGNFSTVQKIVVASNGDVYAATSPGGIMRSKNGGTTWQQVLTGGAGADLEIAANGNIWASIGIFSPGSVWTSSTGDAGTWINKTPSNPATNGMQRIEIALAPSDANTVYLLGHDGNSNDCKNIWYSLDAGANWILRAAPTGTDQVPTAPNFTRGQAWYDLIAAVDPNDPLTLIIGGVDLHKSIDGGAHWIHLTKWYNSTVGLFPTLPTVHADQHAIVYKPSTSNFVLFGNDGGIFYTSNMSATVTDVTPATYTTRNNGYNVTQFYGVAMNPSNANYFLAGAQDNGSQQFNGPGAVSTVDVTGGDGAIPHIDQLNPNNQVAAYVYSYFYLSTDGGATFNNVTSNQSNGSFINPSDYDNTSKYMFFDYTDVATRVGGVYGRWKTDVPVSPTATTGPDEGVTVTNFNKASVTAVKVSPNIPNRVYFGLANGRIVYVDNAGTAVSPVAGTIIKTGQGSVSSIAIEPGNENHILVTYSNYDVQSVFETTDGGTSWVNIEGNLPNMPVWWVVFNPSNYHQAFIATEVGVWSTDNINGVSTEWNPTNGGLANSRVYMLQIAGNQMAAATHGRGLFTTNLTGGAANTPAINFETSGGAGKEANPSVALSCGRGYTDYPVKMYITGPPTGAATVNLNVVSNTATATEGQDFDIIPKTITFNDGDNTPKTFSIRVYDDANTEAEQEFFTIDYTISGATNAVKGTTLQTYDFRIYDDDYLKIPHGATTVYIKSGIYNTNLGGSSPLQGSQSDKKMQYLYRKNELLGMGLKPGQISSLSFTIGTKGSVLPYSGFTIMIGSVPTTTNDLSGGFVSTSGFTTVYSAPSPGYSSVAGENKFDMTSSPFVWDGNSNLVVQFCYDNVAAQPASPVALPAGSPDDILQGEQDPLGLTNQVRAVSTNVPTDHGCDFTVPTLLNIYRPVLLFGQPVPETPVQSVLNRSAQAYLGPNEDVYFYDETDGKLLARIQNLTSISYGCTQIEIDRQAGPSYGSPFTNNTPSAFITTKSFKVIPSQNGTTAGQFKITLYYTAPEKTGWESITGRSWSNTQLVKVSNGFFVPDVSPSSTHIPDIAFRPMTPGSVGTNFSAAAQFNTSLAGGFAVGTPDVAGAPLPAHLLSFKGKIQSNHSNLKWLITSEDNKGYSIERSIDGINFSSIGYVAAQTNQGQAEYNFIDPSAAGNIQYYRLAMINTGNAVKYSSIVKLQNNSIGIGVQLYPTITNGIVNIKYSDPGNERVIIDVYSAIGASVIRKQTMMQDDQLNIQSLAAGTYTVKIALKQNGEVLFTTKIVKQ